MNHGLTNREGLSMAFVHDHDGDTWLDVIIRRDDTRGHNIGPPCHMGYGAHIDYHSL
jgi:hypothetical protein